MKKLPSNWKLTTLGKIAQWGSGGTPDRSNSNYYGGSIPWFKTGELNDGVVTEAEEFLTEQGLKNSSAKLFPKGSIMIAMYGATIGKCAILGVDASTNQACAVAQTFEGVDSKYLFHYLRSQKQNFIDKGKGGAQPNISQTVIKEHPFPLAPLPEQLRIVSKLNVMFDSLNKLNLRLLNISTFIKSFRQTILAKAFAGELTRDWNSTDTWRNLAVGDLSSDVQYGYTAKSTKKVGGTQYLRITDIQDNKVDWSSVPYCDISTNERSKYLLHKNDIVFARTGATVGKSFLIEDEIQNVVFASYLIRVIPKKEYSPKYIWYFFNSPNYWKIIGESAAGIAQPNVNGKILASIIIPIPELREQNEIVRRVESLFASIDRIEVIFKSLNERIDQLPHIILSKAFTGSLVEQVPSDGPAIIPDQAVHVGIKKTRQQGASGRKPKGVTVEKTKEGNGSKEESRVEEFKKTELYKWLLKKSHDNLEFDFNELQNEIKIKFEDISSQLIECLILSEGTLHPRLKQKYDVTSNKVSFKIIK